MRKELRVHFLPWFWIDFFLPTMMKVTSLEQALAEVRKRYPAARMEGSTFDYTFLVAEIVVAKAVTNRRSRKHEWELTVYDKPVEDV